jgi:hypothetical protein
MWPKTGPAEDFPKRAFSLIFNEKSFLSCFSCFENLTKFTICWEMVQFLETCVLPILGIQVLVPKTCWHPQTGPAETAPKRIFPHFSRKSLFPSSFFEFSTPTKTLIAVKMANLLDSSLLSDTGKHVGATRTSVDRKRALKETFKPRFLIFRVKSCFWLFLFLKFH